MLTSGYNHLRPKDKITRRRRLAEIIIINATLSVSEEQPSLEYSQTMDQPPERSDLPASSSSHCLNQTAADDRKAVYTGEDNKHSEGFTDWEDNFKWCDFIDLGLASNLLDTERTTMFESSEGQDCGNPSFSIKSSKDHIGQISGRKLEIAADCSQSSTPSLDYLPLNLHCGILTQAGLMSDPPMAAVHDTLECDEGLPLGAPDISDVSQDLFSTLEGITSSWPKTVVNPFCTTSLSCTTLPMNGFAENLSSRFSPSDSQDIASKDTSHVPSEAFPPTTRATETIPVPLVEMKFPKKWSYYENHTPEDYAKQARALSQFSNRGKIIEQSRNAPSDANIQSTAQVHPRSTVVNCKPGSFNDKHWHVNPLNLSPYVDRMLWYSPAHREDIKNVFRNSPSSYHISPHEVSLRAQQTVSTLNNQNTSIDQIVFSSYEADRKSGGNEKHSISGVSGSGRWGPYSLQDGALVGYGELLDFRTQRCRIRLPGAFICSEINSLKHYGNCKAKYVSAADWRFCEVCHAKSPLASLSKFCISYNNDIYFSDRFGNTLLHVAAAFGVQASYLKDLIRLTPNINAVNTAGETFMHVFDSLKTDYPISFLLDKLCKSGFDFHKRDHQGQTFVHALVRRGVDPISLRSHLHLLLLKDNTGRSISTELVDILTNSGVEVQYDKDVMIDTIVDTSFHLPLDTNQYDLDGTTALIRDLHRVTNADGAVPSLEHLQSLVASVNCRDGRGRSPLHFAVGWGIIEVTKFLLGNGANVNARDVKGQGVLMLADENQRHLDSTLDNYPAMYAKIAACRALAIDAGAIREPGLFDEWDVREGQRFV